MALANYTDLQTAVAEWLAKSNLSTRAPDFIKLAEADLNRKVRVRQNMTTTQLTLTAGTSAVTLPANFLEEIELNYSDQAEALTRAPFDTIDRLQTTDSSPDRPAFYACTSTEIIFETEADATYTLNLRYYEKWDIATDTTNWLLTNAPDVYLFGAMAHAAFYQKDWNTYNACLLQRDTVVFDILKAESRTKSSVLRVDSALAAPRRFDINAG